MNLKLFAFVVAASSSVVATAAVREPPALKTGKDALKVMAENVYGVRPAFTNFNPTTLVGKTEDVKIGSVEAVRKVVRLNTMTSLGQSEFPVVAYFPKKSGKVPVFVYLSFKPSTLTDNPRWPLELILKRGAATAAFCYHDVLKDDPHVLDGVARPADGWGAISAWAFAAGRVYDYLATDAAADKSRIAIVGHSRLGKTAAWAAATDKRFAYACVNDSGCLGARMSYRNQYGETIDWITQTFPHWFAPNCRARWCGKDNELPFDQHWVLGSIAPRLLNVGSADEDWWACPPGEMAGYEYARPAWHGKDVANVTYHIRHGQHDITSEDWTDYLDFAASRGWPVAVVAKTAKPLKVLMIGNSFSVRMVEAMPPVAKSLGLELDVCSLYIGGCSLSNHWANVLKVGAKPYSVTRASTDGAKHKERSGNIPEVLSAEKWDVVTIQQASHFSWKSETYAQGGDELVKYIREKAPQAKIYVQETWSYTPWDERLAAWKITPDEMYAKLHRAYAEFAKRHSLEIIPTGAAVQCVRKDLPVKYTENSLGGDVVGSAKFVQKDGKWKPQGDVFHMGPDGNYLQALVWTAKLFGADVTKCAYEPKRMKPDRAAFLRRTAMKAVTNLGN